MRFSAVRTFSFALVFFVMLAAVACSPAPETCTPACRAGFDCVHGACIQACNPPCSTGQTCVGSGATAQCVAGDGSVAADAADVPTGDTGSELDAADVVPASDVPSTMDTSADVTGTDGSGADIVTDGPPPCGHSGEACCGTYCAPGNECTATGCRAIVRTADECSRPADCTGGQACTGPTSCAGHTCYRCMAASGTTAFGGACSLGTECVTGVCRNRCTVACAIGGTGDADCATQSPGYVCSQYNFRTGGTGMTSTVTLGTCRQSCARAADCTGGMNCLATANTPADRLDFVCGMSVGAGAAGATCTSGSDCQSLLCIPAPMSRFVCTAPCVTAADCPAAAPMCVDIMWLRPGGGVQPGRACSP